MHDRALELHVAYNYWKTYGGNTMKLELWSRPFALFGFSFPSAKIDRQC